MTTKYKRERITYESKEEWLTHRLEDVTSTEMAALFGLSPYTTEFELWHQKKDRVIVEINTNDRMKWGLRLEDAIAQGIIEDREEWKGHRVHQYHRIPDLRIGSSFDWRVTDHHGNSVPMDCKNVDGLVFRNDWEVLDDGTINPPPHIYMQLQVQLLMMDAPYGYLAVLVGGNAQYLVKIERNEKVIDSIIAKTTEFWNSILNGVAPQPDLVKDADLISQMHGYADPGSVLDAGDDPTFFNLVSGYSEMGKQIKELENKRKAIKSQMFIMAGNAEKVVGAGYSISMGVVGPKYVEAFERKGFRNFRVYIKKAKG